MSERSPIINIAKKVCPAVITIVISKDLPKVEGFYFLPFGSQQFAMPKLNKKKEKTKIGGGSGFIVSSDGYVITSSHVVIEPEADYTVILEPEKRCSAKVVSRDPINDIAILKIVGKNFPYLEMGDSDNIELGETVVAVGNALGEFHDSVSVGVVSGLSRYITAISNFAGQTENLRGLIQTDAAINPGNSGGPLIDIEGKVIGINTAVVMGAQNIGFAIPINYVKNDLQEVKKFGKVKRPFLGIKYVLLNKEIAEKNKLSNDYGALVVRETFGEPAVLKGGSAEKAGLKEYDIILECNKATPKGTPAPTRRRGESLAPSEREKITEKNSLAHILQKFKVNDEVYLKVLRDKKEIIVKARLEEKK